MCNDIVKCSLCESDTFCFVTAFVAGDQMPSSDADPLASWRDVGLKAMPVTASACQYLHMHAPAVRVMQGGKGFSA